METLGVFFLLIAAFCAGYLFAYWQMDRAAAKKQYIPSSVPAQFTKEEIDELNKILHPRYDPAERMGW